MFGIQVSLYFHQFIVNNYNFSKHCYYYYYILLQRNYMLQSLFFTVFLFVVRFSPVFCSVLRHLLVQAFRIVPSRPMPSPVQTSKSKLLYIQKDPLDGAASFIPLTVLQIKDLPRWWTRWTNGLYRGPTQEKNYFAPGGNWTRIAQLRVRRSTSRPRVAPCC